MRAFAPGVHDCEVYFSLKGYLFHPMEVLKGVVVELQLLRL